MPEVKVPRGLCEDTHVRRPAQAAAVLVSLAGALPAAADHGAPISPPATGLPLLAWLFVAGLMLLLGLVAWAVFAPSRDDEDRPDPGRSAAILLAVALAGLTAWDAWAHSTVQRMEPRSGAVMTSAPAEVRIVFDGAIEAKFSTIEVLDPLGQQVKAPAPVELDPETHKVLRLRLPALGAGTYTIRWRVLAVDGHRTAGRSSFTIKPAT